MPPISPRKSCALCLVDDSSVSFFQMIDSRQKTTFTHLFLGFSLGGWFNPSLICCWALLGWKKVFEFFLTFWGQKWDFLERPVMRSYLLWVDCNSSKLLLLFVSGIGGRMSGVFAPHNWVGIGFVKVLEWKQFEGLGVNLVKTRTEGRRACFWEQLPQQLLLFFPGPPPCFLPRNVILCVVGGSKWHKKTLEKSDRRGY